MPMPWTYRHASDEWRAILDEAKDRMALDSDNMTYTAIDAVLQVFRRRLTVPQALAFAAVLPAVPRAIFVADWNPDEEPVPFESREDMTREAKQVRKNHNLTPDNAIEATAIAIRRQANPIDFERALAKLPAGAQEFWSADRGQLDA